MHRRARHRAIDGRNRQFGRSEHAAREMHERIIRDRKRRARDQSLEIEAGAEHVGAGAGKNDRADGRIGIEPLHRLVQRRDERLIERIGPIGIADSQDGIRGRDFEERDIRLRQITIPTPWPQSGAARGIRTPDPIITNDVLYRLSYCGNGVSSNRRGRAWQAAVRPQTLLFARKMQPFQPTQREIAPRQPPG